MSKESAKTDGYEAGLNGDEKHGTFGVQGFWDNVEEQKSRTEGWHEGTRDRLRIEKENE